MDQTEYETAVSHMVEAAELTQVNRAELLGRLAGVFARPEPWQQVGKYLDGLASDLPRKNGWTLAEQAGDATPDKMQRLLNHANWDHEQAAALVRGFVAARRARAGVPEQVEFATKPQLAVQILTELHHEARLPDWLTADEVYGQNPTLRTWCEDHNLGYVLGIPRSFILTLGCGTTMRADEALALVAAHGWNYRSAGAGSKGERDYAWAWIGTASAHHHLLVRRNLADPTDLAYFYYYSPPGRPPATLATLVRVAGTRWPVEEDFQTGKSPLRTQP